MTSLESFLSECRAKITAMEHWSLQHDSNRVNWNDGPYPDMKKLVECVEIMNRTLTEYYERIYPEPHGKEIYTRRAKEALNKCEELLK